MALNAIIFLLTLTGCCSCKYCNSSDGVEKNPVSAKDRYYHCYYDQNKKC